MNTLKTGVLMVGLMALLVFFGQMFGGTQGAAIAFVIGMGMNLVSYWFSDKIVLTMYKAQEVDRGSAPALYDMVKDLAARAELPMPKVYIINNPQPNAFATGRNPKHAAVAVTTGIMNILNREELAGVIGHELAHVKHRDILIGTVAAGIAGAIMLLATMARWGAIFGGFGGDRDRGGGNIFTLLAMAILAPIAAMLVQMAISRSREYAADKGGARIAGNPMYLASALNKLEMANKKIPTLQAGGATAHMFIVNPLAGGFAGLFSTHPPIEERINRLRQMQRV